MYTLFSPKQGRRRDRGVTIWTDDAINDYSDDDGDVL